MRRCLEYALEARRRVKEQLKKIGGMEFYDVHFSYIDQETREEKFISVPGAGRRIADPGWSAESRRPAHRCHRQRRASGPLPDRNPGHGGQRLAEDVGPRLEHAPPRRRSRSASTTSRPMLSRVSASIKAGRSRLPPAHRRTAQHRADDGHDPGDASSPCAPASCGKPIQAQMVVLGSMSLGGNIVPVENLAESPAGRLRRRGQAHPAADGQRDGHPDDPRRVVRQVPDRLLRRPGGCGVQGVGGGVARACSEPQWAH